MSIIDEYLNNFSSKKTKAGYKTVLKPNLKQRQFCVMKRTRRNKGIILFWLIIYHQNAVVCTH